MHSVVRAGFAAAALFASVSAFAQTPPSPGRWPMLVGAETCAGQPQHPKGGLNWRLTCTATCPAETALVTGACRVLSGDNQGLALEGSGPAANGWSCDYVATRHDIDRSGGVSPRSRVRAEAHCRDISPFQPARFTTPSEGPLMVIARSGADIGEKMRFGIRVCNTQGPSDLNVHLLLRDPEKPGIPERPAPRAVPVGLCLQVDGPVAVFVQNGSTQATGVSGAYQLYREGTFKPVPEVKTSAEIAASARDERAIERRIVKAGAPEPVRAICEKSESAPKGVWGKCTVKDIAEQGNFRLCFSSRYAAPVNEEPNHPGDLLPMVVNPKLVDQAPPDGYFGDRPGARDVLNPIYANSCRDYLNVRDVNILVLQRPGVPLDDLKEVWFTVQKLG